MTTRLEGIKLKLDRAKEGLDQIDPRWQAWQSEEEPIQWRAEIDQRKRRYIVVVRSIKPLPPVLALIGDEVVHHIRSSLDHLACYLVEASDGKVTNSTAWPIVRSHWEWTRRVERQKRPFQLWRKKGGGPLAHASPEARAFVKDEQPYRRGSKTRDDPLLGLEKLWNTEKHRILNPTPVYALPSGSWRQLFTVTPAIEPVQFKWLIRPDDELKAGTKFALLRFPLDEPLPKVVMKGEFPAQIAIGDGKSQAVRLEETLDLVRRIVGDAETRFPIK